MLTDTCATFGKILCRFVIGLGQVAAIHRLLGIKARSFFDDNRNTGFQTQGVVLSSKSHTHAARMKESTKEMNRHLFEAMFLSYCGIGFHAQLP